MNLTFWISILDMFAILCKEYRNNMMLVGSIVGLGWN
jgi:hypothetical protein